VCHRLSKSCWATANPGRGGNAWMLTHERWLGSQRFHEPALAATYAHYRAVLQGRDAQLEGIEADLAVWYDAPPFADAVHRLSAYRGMTRLGALTLASVVCDWRRFPGSASGAPFRVTIATRSRSFRAGRDARPPPWRDQPRSR
jgi:hypothetical protein